MEAFRNFYLKYLAVLPNVDREKVCTDEIYNNYIFFTDLQRIINKTLTDTQKDQGLRILKNKQRNGVRFDISFNSLGEAFNEIQQETIQQFLERTNFLGTPFQEIEFVNSGERRIDGFTDSKEFSCYLYPDGQTGQYGILNECLCTPNDKYSLGYPKEDIPPNPTALKVKQD